MELCWAEPPRDSIRAVAGSGGDLQRQCKRALYGPLDADMTRYVLERKTPAWTLVFAFLTAGKSPYTWVFANLTKGEHMKSLKPGVTGKGLDVEPLIINP